MTRFFVTGTGTDVGKTVVTRGIARALRNAGTDVVAIKPMETGYFADQHATSDAAALETAAKRELPRHCWYRAAQPLAPAAICLESGQAAPDPQKLIDAIQNQPSEVTLVEGAGGVCVPLSAKLNTTDLIKALDSTTILVASNTLGVLSHTLTALHVLRSIHAKTLCIVLTHLQPAPEPSWKSNASILRHESQLPVIEFPFAPLSHREDDDLAELAQPIAALIDATRSASTR